MSDGKKLLNELDDDIRDHIERETQANIDRGMQPEEARHAAMRKFGNVTRVKEETRAVWISAWLEELVQDVRYGLRAMRNSLGFTAVAILTLALGIGANTAIFSLIDAVMLRSLPVEKPSQLMLLQWNARNEPRYQGYMSSGDCAGGLAKRDPGQNPSGCSLSEPMFRTIEKSQQFTGVAAFANSGFLSMTGSGPASMINGQLVSGDFFRTMGIKPAIGRVLNTNDDTATAASVAVLSYGFWQRNFGGAPDVVGKTIELNSVPCAIVGVAEQRFTGVTPGSDFDVWMPLSMGRRITDQRMWNNREQNVSFWWLTVLGRMKEGGDPQQVQTVVSGIFRNEMINGAVPLFDATDGMFGPGGPGPGPATGGTQVRSQMMVGGPGPGPAGPGPSGGAARGMVGGPSQGPASGPAHAVVGGITNVPRTIQGGVPAGSGPRTAEPSGSGPQTLGVAPGGPPAEAAAAQRTLSKPDDAPTITLVNAQTGLVGSRQRFANPLYVLMGAVGIILLIACSNVAGLMLARATARQKEMALRLALGAGRWRVIRQLLTESLMLAVAGGVLGILFASWGAHSILSFVSSNQPRPVTFAAGIDLRVLAFTAVVSLFTGILFGVAPALRSTRLDLTPALKEGFGVASALARGTGRKLSVGNALVVTQVALAVVVLVGAGLLVRTLQNLRSIDVGFDSHNLVLFGINPSLAGYKDSQIDSFYRDLQGRLEQTPGVKSASYSMFPLLSGALMITSFHWPGTPQDRESDSDSLSVGPSFFSTMQIPFLTGRNFNSTDYQIAANPAAASSVPCPVVVNQAFVAKYLGQENPIGKRFGESAGSDMEPTTPGYEIIGVVRDTKYGNLRREINPMMYRPQTGMGASFEVRTAGDPQALVGVIRSTVAQINPNLPLRDVSTESQQIDRLLFQERLVARLSGFFGVLAMVLACIGLYGLLAYEVERRSREIGIRTALGAQEGDVLRLVVKQGLWLTLVGAIVGAGAAIGVTRYLSSLLFEVHAYDPITIGVVVVMLVIVALAACLIPARRATHVDPIVALRCE